MTRNLFRNLYLSGLASCVLLGSCVSLFVQQSSGTSAQSSGSSEVETPSSPPPAVPSGQHSATADRSQARLSDLAWLEGKWQGNWGPRLAEQVWMAPEAGEILGLFRVVENDKTLVVEMYSVLETGAGVELRLRHFTASLAPWEQSSTAVLRLASLDPKGAVFENTSGGQPSRQMLIRVDPDNYISRSEITSGGDNKQVTEIRFHRQNPVAEAAPPHKKK